MAVVGTAEVEVRANVRQFERDLRQAIDRVAKDAEIEIEAEVETEGIEEATEQVDDLSVASSGAAGAVGGRLAGASTKANAALSGAAAQGGIAGAAMERLGASSGAAGAAMSGGLAAGALAAAAGIGVLGVKTVQSASAVNEAINAVNVVFGDAADTILEFSENSARAVGLAQSQFLQMAAGLGNISQGMGLTEEASADLSISLTKLAADLASVRDENIEDVLVAIRSGLVGETEPLRRFVGNLDKAAVEARALELGLIDVGEELTNQAQVLAFYDLLLEKSNDLQGDFQNTSDSLANAMRIFQAQLEDLSATIGQAFLPAASDLVSDLNDVVEGFNNLIELIPGMEAGLGKLIGKIVELLSPLDDLAALMRFLGLAEEEAADSTEEYVTAQELAKKSTQEAGSAIEGAAPSLLTFTDAMGSAGQASTSFALDAEAAAAAASNAASVFQQASQAFQQRLGGFIPEFGETFREEGAKAAGGAGGAADAQRRLTRAVEDGNRRIQRAQENIASAFEDADERIADSRRRVADIQVRAAREVRDAEEKLLDTRRKSARRIEDAKEALADAEEESAERIAEAQEKLRRLEEGRAEDIEGLTARQVVELRKREKIEEVREDLADTRAKAADRVEDAEERLARAQEDATRRITRAERDLRESRIDTAKDVQDAQRDLQRTIEDSNERIADSQERLADVQRNVARQIADAQRSIAQSGAAAAGAAGDQALSVSRLAESFRTNAADLQSFVDALDQIEEDMSAFATNVEGIADEELKEAFLARLAELGPEAVPLLRELTRLSDDELEGLVEVFGDQVVAAKEAADREFDKFPTNFQKKISAATNAAARELDKLVDEFEALPSKTGPPADRVGSQMDEVARTIIAMRDQGTIALSDVEQSLLELALSTDDPRRKTQALKDLVASLEGKSVTIEADVDPALRNLEQLNRALDVVFPRRRRLFGGSDFGTLFTAPLQHGGPVTPGAPFLVGERGPELFVPNRQGNVVSNRDVLKALRQLAGTTNGSGGGVGDINVTEAIDARATVREIERRIIRQWRRG